MEALFPALVEEEIFSLGVAVSTAYVIEEVLECDWSFIKQKLIGKAPGQTGNRFGVSVLDL